MPQEATRSLRQPSPLGPQVRPLPSEALHPLWNPEKSGTVAPTGHYAPWPGLTPTGDSCGFGAWGSGYLLWGLQVPSSFFHTSHGRPPSVSFRHPGQDRCFELRLVGATSGRWLRSLSLELCGLTLHPARIKAFEKFRWSTRRRSV